MERGFNEAECLYIQPCIQWSLFLKEDAYVFWNVGIHCMWIPPGSEKSVKRFPENWMKRLVPSSGNIVIL